MKFNVANAAVAVACLVAAPVSAKTFEGPFVGVQGGWNHDDVTSTGSNQGRLAIDRARDEFIGGGFVGYDHQIVPNLVVGVEGGISATTSDRLSRVGRDSVASINPRYVFDLSARAGYLITEGTLVYVRGGYDALRARVRLTDNSTSRRGNDTFDGWLAGGGVEQALSDRVSARVEYRYSDVGSGSGKFDRNQVLVGVAYHF